MLYSLKFLSDLGKGIRTPFRMFSWKKGRSRVGDLVNILWRIPSCEQERFKNFAFQSQAASLAHITICAGRLTRQIFFSLAVKPSFVSSKAAAMALYEHITGERLPKDVGKARDYVVWMAELALITRDSCIMQDLRALNGRTGSPSYDVFWSELKIILESHASVDDRRHGKLYNYLHSTLPNV